MNWKIIHMLSFSLLISNINIGIWMNINTQVHSHSFSYMIVIWLFKKCQVFVETKGSSPPEIPSFMSVPAHN